MSKIERGEMACITLLFCVMLFLVGCSNGDGGAKPGQLVDPSSTYTGVTTKAVPTEANAEDLAIGGFYGTRVASSIGSVAKTSGSSAVHPAGYRPVFTFAQVLKQSVQWMGLPQKAALLRKSSSSASATKSVGRTSNYQLQGDNGGTASYSLDIDDVTGSVSGTIVYQGFASNGIVIDGTTDFLGTFEPNKELFSRVTLSFHSLTFQTSTSATPLVLAGSLSWEFTYVSPTETLFMNMVLRDQDSAKTYWYNNYERTTVYTGTSQTLTISGRYYDHDNGSVDLTTLTPLIAIYGNQWPSLGSLAFSGDLGRWVRLNFQANTLVIEADTNGDGVADWQVERPSNVALPTAIGSDPALYQFE